MDVNEAINFLAACHNERLNDIAILLKRLPQTKDGFYVLPGDFLEPIEDVEYLCGIIGEPEVVMQAHYILESGQHITDSVSNFNRGKDE